MKTVENISPKTKAEKLGLKKYISKKSKCNSIKIKILKHLENEKHHSDKEKQDKLRIEVKNTKYTLEGFK